MTVEELIKKLSKCGSVKQEVVILNDYDFGEWEITDVCQEPAGVFINIKFKDHGETYND